MQLPTTNYILQTNNSINNMLHFLNVYTYLNEHRYFIISNNRLLQKQQL